MAVIKMMVAFLGMVAVAHALPPQEEQPQALQPAKSAGQNQMEVGSIRKRRNPGPTATQGETACTAVVFQEGRECPAWNSVAMSMSVSGWTADDCVAFCYNADTFCSDSSHTSGYGGVNQGHQCSQTYAAFWPEAHCDCFPESQDMSCATNHVSWTPAATLYTMDCSAPAAAADQCTAVPFGVSAGLKGPTDAAFSPNGRQIAVGDYGNKRALILDAATGDTIEEISGSSIHSLYPGAVMYGVGNVHFSGPDMIDISMDPAMATRYTISTKGYTPVGSGGVGCIDGTFDQAKFGYLKGITANPNATITAVADYGCHSVRFIDWAAQTVTSIGPMDMQYRNSHASVKDGPGSVAEFQGPGDVDWSLDGTMIVVVDHYNNAVRLVTYPGLVVSTLAGSGNYSKGHVDGVGRDALFNGPMRASFSPDSKYVVVSDLNADLLRKVEVATGVVTTLTGFTTGANGLLDGPYGLEWHPTDPTKVIVANHYRDHILVLTCAELVPPPPPTGNPTPGPTSNPTPGPTTNPSPGPTASPSPGPTPGPTSQMDALEDKMDSVLAALLNMKGNVDDIKDLLNQHDQAPVCYGRRSQA